MKKQTKIKIKNIWNKLKKPLMIFSFVGNILFLLFIIVGCVGTKKQTTQTNATDESLYTLRDTTWVINEVNWGENGAIYTLPSGYKVSSRVTHEESYVVSFNNLYNENNGYFKLRFRVENTGSYLFYYIYGDWYDETTLKSDTLAYCNYDFAPLTFNGGLAGRTIEFNRSMAWDDAIHSTTDTNNDFENQQLINWFYSVAELQNADFKSFEFLSQINYNAPFGQPLDTMFINATDTHAYTLNINLPVFESNGLLFNKIRVRYLPGYSMKYRYDNMSATNTNEYSWYFMEMEYVNTLADTESSVVVNYRNFIVESDTYLTKGSTWKAGSYRYLKFQNELTPQQRQDIECFNNDSFSGFSNTSTDVGVSNVFTLLGSAFVSLRGIFAIELLPNITIGLLVFMPLVVGIIITIIWLVKR